MIVEFLLLLALAAFAFYKWSTLHYKYFEKSNLYYDTPVPFLGSQKDFFLRKSSFYDHINRLYKLANTKVIGVFDLRSPVYFIRDPALVKKITIKEFDHFVNRRRIFPDDDSDLFGNSLASMSNEKWKDMRSTLSPVFTGSKLRQMFTLINEVAHESIQFLKNNEDIKNGMDLDTKDFFARFSTDVIASTAFGLQVNSFKDKDNKFYLMGKKITKFSFWQNIKLFMFSNLKYVMKLLNISLFDNKDIDCFKRIVLDTIKHRQANEILRPDLIQTLMEAKGTQTVNTENPTKRREWTEIELVAQAFLFFFAGFEATSVLMSFAAHELMINPDIQEKLRQEIMEVKESLDGKLLTYDALQGMKYLDMVVSETLRRWPSAVATDRRCEKDFSYKDDEIEVNIKAGETIWIPIVGYHMDEEYFPNPEKFDPERFSDENKGSIQSSTYLPFGLGPRNCIGNRFALLEAKAVLFYLLSEFQLNISSKATIPMKLLKGGINLGPKNGFWVNILELPN